MIKEEYVSFETAKLLKEKGFPQDYDIYHSLVYNEKDYEDEYEVQRMVLETRFVKAGTLSSYPVGVPDPKCYCPTQALTMRWLREVHNLIIEVRVKHHFRIFDGYYAGIVHLDGYIHYEYTPNEYPTYEEACEAAIKYCLENLI